MPVTTLTPGGAWTETCLLEPEATVIWPSEPAVTLVQGSPPKVSITVPGVQPLPDTFTKEPVIPEVGSRDRVGLGAGGIMLSDTGTVLGVLVAPDADMVMVALYVPWPMVELATETST